MKEKLDDIRAELDTIRAKLIAFEELSNAFLTALPVEEYFENRTVYAKIAHVAAKGARLRFDIDEAVRALGAL